MLKCFYCKKEFRYESERKRHEQSHAPQFQCKICCKKFSFLSALRRHEKQHERKGSVNCDLCGGKFRDEALLVRHMKYAHEGHFSCSECNGNFNSEVALRNHMKTHKPDSERKYHCSHESCGKSFNFAHHLKHHELSHTDTKQHFCKICGKGFIQPQHYKSHMKTHTPDDWLPCAIEECKKKFPTEYSLRRHHSTHDNFLCNNCGQRVSQRKFPDHRDKCFSVKENIGANSQGGAEEKMDNGSSLSAVVNNNNFKGASQNLRTVDFVKAENNNNAVSQSVRDGCPSKNDTFSKIDKGGCVLNQNVDICSSCDCANICNSDRKAICDNERQANVKPKIDYTDDGFVWIDVSDIDFDPHLVNGIQNPGNKLEIKIAPINSCKDVLGNCIVSGDGTIGEGCLCAKMAIDDQEMSAQEIDEITPCPK